MKLGILAVGKSKKGPETELTHGYLSRLPHYAGLFETDSRLPAGPERTKDEGLKLLQYLERSAPSGSHLVCLDPYGKDTSSEQLSQLIRNNRQAGIPACYFAIGGADGHSPEILRRANLKIAFGSATWPHLLCRAMLAEQLYRAEMILTGHPYHRQGPAR